jgi:predicted nucleic acid-binding protein
VKLTGTIGILKIAASHKIINLSEGNLILAKMIDRGFYSPVKSLKEV